MKRTSSFPKRYLVVDGRKYAYRCSGYAYGNEVVLWNDAADKELAVVSCSSPKDALEYLKAWVEGAPGYVCCRLLNL